MMKKLLFTVACAMIGSIVNAQVINSFPFTEDFETQAAGPTGCGPLYSTTGNTWSNGDDVVPAIPTHFVDWTADLGGTSSSGTGPSVDHTLGTAAGIYLYAETSCSGTGYSNSEFDLVSPYMDFTALTAPQLSFWRHQFGTTQGLLHVDVQVGALGPWILDIVPATTDNVDLWQETTASLLPAAGLDSVRIRIRYISGISFGGDVAVDDITVFETAAIDLFTVSVDSITSGCGLGLQDVWTTIDQVGSIGPIAGDTIFANYMDGTTTINDTIVLLAPLGPGGTYNHMFSAQADYSVPGTYNVTVDVTNSADPNSGNDTTFATINSIPLVSGFPYLEDFESGNGGWIVGGANTTFELAVPNNTIINMSASDSMAYVTNATGLYNPNENGYVTGPCFDFTAVDSTDVFSMSIWRQSENSWDGANVMTSLDGGTTWDLFGSMGDPTNWYNDNTINGTPGGSQIGWTNNSNGWVKAHHTIGSALAGQSSVLWRVNFGSDGSVQQEGFAFDDVQIGTPVALDTTIADQTVCGDFTTFYGSTGTYEYASQDTATLVVTEIDTVLSGVMVFNNPGATDSTFNLIVRFTDYLGCVTIDTTQLTLVPAPNATIEGDTTICFDGNALYTVATGANYEYLWSDLTTMDSAWFNTGGMIGVTVTDTITGCSDTDSSLVTMTIAVDIPAATANVCGGDSLLVDAGTYDTYLWSTTEMTQTIYVSTPGTYTVTATDTVVGCVSMDSIVITTSLPVPAITGVIDTICANGSMVLDAGAGFSSYSWTTSGSSQTETVNGASLPLGDNTVTVTVTDGNGCSNTDAVTFFIDGCASIDELNAIAMTLFPNPSTGVFNYSIDNMAGRINMMIVDVTGKIVEAGELTTATGTIDLSTYESGIYILKLQAGDAVKTVRLVKK